MNGSIFRGAGETATRAETVAKQSPPLPGPYLNLYTNEETFIITANFPNPMAPFEKHDPDVDPSLGTQYLLPTNADDRRVGLVRDALGKDGVSVEARDIDEGYSRMRMDAQSRQAAERAHMWMDCAGISPIGTTMENIHTRIRLKLTAVEQADNIVARYATGLGYTVFNEGYRGDSAIVVVEGIGTSEKQIRTRLRQWKEQIGKTEHILVEEIQA
jgi:hypothetical protein